MGGRDQSQVKVKNKKFEKIKSVPKDIPKSHNNDTLLDLMTERFNFNFIVLSVVMSILVELTDNNRLCCDWETCWGLHAMNKLLDKSH